MTADENATLNRNLADYREFAASARDDYLTRAEREIDEALANPHRAEDMVAAWKGQLEIIRAEMGKRGLEPEPAIVYAIILGGDEVAGQAPGRSRWQALENFNGDVFGGDGEMVMTANGARLVLRGEVGKPKTDSWYRAEKREDVEGGIAVTLGETEDDRPVVAWPQDRERTPRNRDERYTAERLASYTLREVAGHLEARREQRARAEMELAGDEALIASLTDEQIETTEEGADALYRARKLAEEIGELIARLERREQELIRKAIETARAEWSQPQLDLIERKVLEAGLPLGPVDAGDEEMATSLWRRAHETMEALEDETPTNEQVAQRVADTYAVLYGIKGAGNYTLDIDDVDARALAGFLRPNAEQTRHENPADWPHRVVDQLDAQAAR